MLAKQAYGIYLAIIFFSLFFKKYKEVSISILIHMIPLIIYLFLLKFNGIEYYNHEIVCCNAPTWIFNDLLLRPIPEILHVGIFSFHTFLIKSLDHYSIIFFMFIIFIFLFLNKKIINETKFKTKYMICFLLLVIFFNWVQFFAGNRWWYGYLAISEYTTFVYAGASFIILSVLNLFKKNIKKKLIIASIPLIICISMFRIINFPYEHPYDQKEYLIKDRGLYDQFEN